MTDDEYAELRGMSLRDAAAIEAMKALIQCAHGPNGGWQHVTRDDIIGEAFYTRTHF